MKFHIDQLIAGFFVMSTFSERLKAARGAAGLTQRDLANRLDLTRGAIALWESDGSAGTTPRNVRLMDEVASVLGVTRDWLLDDSVDPETAWKAARHRDRADHHGQVSRDAEENYARERARFLASMGSKGDKQGLVRPSRGILDALPPPADVLPDLEQDGHLFVFAQTAGQIEHKMQTLKNASDNVQKHLVLIGCEGKVFCVKDPAEALSKVVQFLRKV